MLPATAKKRPPRAAGHPGSPLRDGSAREAAWGRTLGVAQELVYELREFAGHTGAGDCEVDSGSFRSLPGLRVDVGVEAEDWDAKSYESFRILRVQVGHKKLCAVDGSLRQSRREGYVVTGRRGKNAITPLMTVTSPSS